MKELLKKVRRLEIKTRRMVDTTFAGEYHSAFKGQGLEFDEVRHYQFGDDIRSIDWNVTAKTGEVFIKTYREEREQTLFVLFDVSGSEDFGVGKENKLIIGAEIAAILSFSAMKNSDKIGLVTFSDQIEKFYPPKKGRKHVLSLIRGLLQHTSSHSRTSIKTALDFAKRILKRRSILIVISDFIDKDYEKSLKYLARKHDVILIRLFNPKEIMKIRTGVIPVFDKESNKMIWINSGDPNYARAVAESFDAIEAGLQTLGNRYRMDTLSLDTSTDYIVELEKFFRKRNGKRKIS